LNRSPLAGFEPLGDNYLKVLRDARAKEIEAEPAVSYEQRIEILGQHIFGDLWKPRNIPGVVSLSPEQVAALGATDAPPVPGENGDKETREKIRRPKADGLN